MTKHEAEAAAPSATPLTAEAGELRSFTICKDHVNAEWNQPELGDLNCVLCRLFYLEAQETLLEEWQQRAKRAEDAIAEIERPLDAQMERLNNTVIRLTADNERQAAEIERLRGLVEEAAEIAGREWHLFSQTKEAHERNSPEPFRFRDFGLDYDKAIYSLDCMERIRAALEERK